MERLGTRAYAASKARIAAARAITRG